MHPDVAGLILAAGFSSRMGEFKPTALVPGGPMVLVQIRLLLEAGLGRIEVVTGHRHQEIEELLQGHPECGGRVRTVFNPRYPEGMFSSIQAGVQVLSPDTRAFFVLPSDCPGVRAETLLRLMADFKASPCDAVFPRCNGHRGHPPLLAAHLLPELTAWQGEGGLRAFLCARNTRELAFADPSILNDLDTPEDLARFRQAFSLQ